MKWSKVKKLVEATFAASVCDRVHVYTTAYQCSCGRAWITIDGKEIADLSTLVTGMKYQCVYHESTITNCVTHPAVPDKERVPGHLVEPGEFSRFDLHEACWHYLISDDSTISCILGNLGKFPKNALYFSSGKKKSMIHVSCDHSNVTNDVSTEKRDTYFF